MKLKFLLSFFSVCFSVVYVSSSYGKMHSENSINRLGVTKLFDVETTSLSVIGPLTFKNLKVKETGTIIGPAKGEKGKFQDLTVTGSLEFDDLTVLNHLRVTGDVKGSFGTLQDVVVVGPLDLKETICQSLSATGPVDVFKLTVLKNTEGVGDFKAQESTFMDMTLTSSSVFLEKTSLQNLLIKKNLKNKALQEITLKNHTLIMGGITFESRMGKIFIDKTSEVKGKITGGTVKHLE